MMNGLIVLILSWLIVGALCYLMIAKVGTITSKLKKPIIKSSTTSSIKNSNNENSIDCLNGIISWLFSNMHRVPNILHAWIIAMNEAAKKISIPGKFEVLFEGFNDNKNITKVPRITDISLQQSPNDHLIIKGKISIPEISLKLMSSQRMGDRLLVTNYDAKIIDLHGEIELRLACIANQIYMMACFSGRPELDIELKNRDSSSIEAVSNTLVDEMIRKCLLSAVTNVSLSETISGQYDKMTTDTIQSNNIFQSISRMTTNIDRSSDTINNSGNLPTVSLSSSSSSTTHGMMKRINQTTSPINYNAKQQQQGIISNKMRVKVIRAQQLNNDHSVNQPYVVLEMDEPAQKFQTKHATNQINPYWDESFDFDLTSKSEEILFEIYEGCNGDISTGKNNPENIRFLGLAIVGLEEIRYSNANTTYTLNLQGRPYRNDMITGNLCVQFDFYNESMKNNDETIIRNNNQIHETLSSSTRRPIYDPRENFGTYDSHIITPTTDTVKNISQHSLRNDHLTGASVTTTVQQTTTTPMVYESYDYDDKQQQQQQQQQYHHLNNSTTIQKQSSIGLNDYITGQPGNATMNRIQQHVLPGSSTEANSTPEYFSSGNRDHYITTDSNNYPYHRYNEQQEDEKLMKTKLDEIPQTDEIRQSRDQIRMHDEVKMGRKRERSFFSELRERLTKRRHSKRRAKSCELSIGEMEETVSLPPSRDASRTRFSEKSSSRHDLASTGGKSERSIKSLYQHSTLILETHENDKKQYYLIPHTLLDAPGATKLLREGKKLHIHNDHTFVAVKSRSGTICNVCHQRIGRSSFSKQAYQCRDCRTVCHKSCHYKTDSYCTASTVNKLNVIKDVDWEYLLTTNQIDEFISEDGI